MGKKYVILGGGGSFGLITADYLLKNTDCERIINIGRNSAKSECFTLNVGKGDKRYSYHTYHITYEIDLLMEFLDKCRPDIIINYAAQGESAVSWKNSWRFFETNAVGLSKLVELLIQRDYLKRFIQISTSELYGSAQKEPFVETSPLVPSSPYAASKAAFDMYLLSMSSVLKFPMHIIRPSNAYCPGQLLHRVIPRTILCGLTKQKLPLEGGGRAEKSYLHARDLANAILLVSEKATLGTVYNVGPDQAISIKDLIEKIAHAMNIPFDELCAIVPDRVGQDSRYWLNSSAIKRDLGWKPTITLEEGLQEMIAWCKKYKNELIEYPQIYQIRA
jgi:dTDP-glucose 4,6-dehydratase